MSRYAVTLIICILAVTFSLYREYRRDNKARLVGRMIAALITIAALGCLAIPLTYTTTTGTGNASKILLTEGFNSDRLPKNDSLFTLDNTIHQRYPKAKLLDNVLRLYADTTRVNRLDIYGYGLDKNDLKQLDGKPVTFHPSPIPDGFTAINWTDKLKTGQPFIVQGRYKNRSAKVYTILLKGLNTTLDSVRIAGTSQSAFTLTATPKNIGRAVYRLFVLDGKDTMQQEHLPLMIESPQPIKALILSSSPDFDTKFLKGWLGGNGYSVASRTVITKGKLAQEYINTEHIDLSHITSSILQKFDLVVGDLSALESLSTPEKLDLQNQVSQTGLGLIIRTDSVNKTTSWLQNNLRMVRQSGKAPGLSALNILGSGKTAALNLEADGLIPQRNMQTLVTGPHNHILSAISVYGAGKMAFTTIHNSYSWVLSGNQKDYNALWSLMIDKVARKSSSSEYWSVAGSVPLVGQPTELAAVSVSLLNNVLVNKTMVYPSQDPTMPFRQTFTYWPFTVGWQQVKHGSSQPFWWYVWDNTDWQALRAAGKIKMNTAFFVSNEGGVASIAQKEQKIKASVPKIYFYILFLMAATFLWAESKFYR